MKAPKLDFLLDVFGDKSYNPDSYDVKVKEKINRLYDLLDKIKPIGDDEYRVLYFSADRGNIEDYGDYEELKNNGEVSSYEEFESYFSEEYPDELCWYKISFSRYKNYRMISINSKIIVYADMDQDAYFESSQLQELMDYLIVKVNECIDMLKEDTYNEYILKNYSYKNRFGVIKRSDYWKIYPDVKNNLLNNISQEEMDYFINNASDNIDKRINNMTSGKYFECVKLAYEVNDYDIFNKTNKELYLKYADGRDEGLSEIDDNSSEEFDKWFHDDIRFGGHPWEIIVGHHFARVNLGVGCDDSGYYLTLDGRIILRKIEIAKIFNILSKNNVAVRVYNSDIIKEAFKGNDYIGVVPNDILPIECGGYFKEYKPVEFIHMEDEKMFKYIKWEGLEKIELKNV